MVVQAEDGRISGERSIENSVARSGREDGPLVVEQERGRAGKALRIEGRAEEVETEAGGGERSIGNSVAIGPAS